eukprot:m51a1_g14164 hypothetical protein (97) ;mRNA; r:3070-3430
MFGHNPPLMLEGQLCPEHRNGVMVDKFVVAWDKVLREVHKCKIIIESTFCEGMKQYYDMGHGAVHMNEVKMKLLWDGLFTVVKCHELNINIVQLRT